MNDAWQEGNDAFWAGKDVTDNPYDIGTESEGDWLEGWEDAYEDAAQGV